jgi:hypothetical protein
VRPGRQGWNWGTKLRFLQHRKLDKGRPKHQGSFHAGTCGFELSQVLFEERFGFLLVCFLKLDVAM